MLNPWFDPLAVLVIFAGAPLAAGLRCGWQDVVAAGASLRALIAPRFDEARTRAELGRQLAAIGKDGLLRAAACPCDDDEFKHLAGVMLRRRSLETLDAEHRAFTSARENRAEGASRFLDAASDLAPVMGLAGTLVALGGSAAPAADALGAAIGQAVVTTVYGLVAANFLFAPLAAAITRRARHETLARTAVLDWLAHQLTASTAATMVNGPPTRARRAA